MADLMADLWMPGQSKPSDLVDDYADAQYERKPHGVVLVDGKEVASTLMCPHCGQHFVSRKGSGTRRHLCRACQYHACCSDPRCHPDYFHGVLGKPPIADEYGISQGKVL